MPPHRSPLFAPSLAAALSLVTASALAAQHGAHGSHAKSDTATSIAGAVGGAMSAHGMGAADDPHVRLSPLRPESEGDRERATRLADEVRRGIARYRDVRTAEREGYRPFFVGDTSVGAVLHYTHIWRGVLEGRRLKPEEPGSLLYEKQRDGSLRLVGAMYTAPPDATPEELDRRVPLSMGRWHLHTDLCLPKPVWSREEWARTRDGRPLFGPESPIATRDACEAVGGSFKSRVFGWMVHANVVDETDPTAIWGGAHRPGSAHH